MTSSYNYGTSQAVRECKNHMRFNLAPWRGRHKRYLCATAPHIEYITVTRRHLFRNKLSKAMGSSDLFSLTKLKC